MMGSVDEELLIRNEYRVTEGDEVFQVLFAVDVPAEHVRVVTPYRPDPQAWETDQLVYRV
jgi:hypothetical protein